MLAYCSALCRQGEWPYISNIGDALRASVTAPNAAALRQAWESIRANTTLGPVFLLKNKFRQAADELVFDDKRGKWVLPDGGRRIFPNLHLNVLFQADGCAPLVSEVQIHLRDVLALNKQDHKLYEVKRASSIHDLLTKEADESEGYRAFQVPFSMDRTLGRKASVVDVTDVAVKVDTNQDDKEPTAPAEDEAPGVMPVVLACDESVEVVQVGLRNLVETPRK